MGPDRSYDGNGVNFGRSQNLGGIANYIYVGICLPSACARRRRLIANSMDGALFQAVEVTDNIRPPVPVPNYTKLNHSCRFPILIQRLSCGGGDVPRRLRGEELEKRNV